MSKHILHDLWTYWKGVDGKWYVQTPFEHKRVKTKENAKVICDYYRKLGEKIVDDIHKLRKEE